MKSVNVISNIKSKTLTKGARYPVIKVVERVTGYARSNTKKYRIVGDDGTIREYKASNFREEDNMLNGKFVVKEIKNFNTFLKEGDVINFKNGNCLESEDFKNIIDILRFSTIYGMKVEPYKEYLTINDLAFREQNKRYEDENGEVWRVDGGNLLNDDEEDITDVRDLDGILSKLFTEVNPNKERIEELEREIESLKDAHEVSKILIEKEKEMIAVREKELEGLL